MRDIGTRSTWLWTLAGALLGVAIAAAIGTTELHVIEGASSMGSSNETHSIVTSPPHPLFVVMATAVGAFVGRTIGRSRT